MVAVVAHQSNIPDLGAHLYIGGPAVDLQVLHHGDGVAICQNIARRITNDGQFIRLRS